MLFEKARHPDQNLYLHPGTRGMPNPSILVPNFIERRYDDMIEARSRDGSSDTINTNKQSLNLNNIRHDIKSTSTYYSLPPILESDNTVKQEPSKILLSDTENNNHIDNSNTEIAQTTLSTPEQHETNDNTLKHPLKPSWTFWYFDMNGGAASWDENLKKVCDVTTIEDFWAVYHHMQEVAALESGCDYALFKTGIRPMWEDPANKEGGRWLLTLDRFQRLQYLNQIWLEIMLYLIGGDHKDDNTDDCINGAVVNIRNKADKVALWLPIADKNQGHGPKILEVGHELKSRMAIPKHFPIHFETHSNVSTRRGSTAKSEFIL
jgi:translation initiation factor 4E